MRVANGKGRMPAVAELSNGAYDLGQPIGRSPFPVGLPH